MAFKLTHYGTNLILAAAATSEHNQQHHNNGALPTAAANATTTAAAAAATLQVANPLDNATTRQRFATHSYSNNNNNSSSNDDQFVNRPLCRTPPPVYNAAAVQALPATPPPSYTPRNVLHALQQSEEQQYATTTTAAAAEPEVLPLAERQHVGRPPQQQQQPRVVYAQVDEASIVEQRRQLATRAFVEEVQEQEENATNRNELRIATAQSRSRGSSLSQQQRQQQQQQRRRRRLQLLQQQHFSNINATSTDSIQSSNSDSETDFAADSSGLQERRPTHGIRDDAYCPDLLHACALILQQPPTSSSASSIGSFTATLSNSADSDYVEIDEIRFATAASSHRTRGNDNLRLRARSTPELRSVAPDRTAEDEVNGNATATSPTDNTPRLERVANRNTNQRREAESQEMGQNLSLRRPRISLTWVLREQQQQQQPQTNEQQKEEKQTTNSTAATNLNPPPPAETQNNNNGYANGHDSAVKPLAPPTHLLAPKKRYRVKQLPGSNTTCADPLNGYATTPTAHTPAAGNAVEMPQKFFSNQNLLDYKAAEKTRRAPSRELLFVCTPQRLPKSATSYEHGDALALAKKRNEIRKKLAAKMAALQANSRAADGAESAAAQSTATTASQANGGILGNDELKSLKGTYSEPSLIAASEGNHHRRHRHRKRRERNRVQKFGYEIRNVDEFLTKCSLASPGNIPVVLSNASTLYQTRPGGYQVEIPLPLGMVVNAVFKNQNWLYVQTPHAEEGYVGYACCLPLGILPPAARGVSGSNTRPTPCWESNGDVFPRPCGNMTDSEKEIRLRGGTRSDGARTPRGKRGNTVTETAVAVVSNGIATETTDAVNGNTSSQYGEHHVDKLYLRAASQPRLVEKAYAQLKSTKAASLRSATGNEEYVTLQQKSKQHVRQHMQQQQLQQQQLQQKPAVLMANGPYITNGHNGQHLHPKNALVAPQTVLAAVRKQQAAGLRQTLVAISADYAAEGITLQKGEIVTLCECRESKDQRQWFYVKTRDGREGYIPAELAGHGYL